MTPNRRMSPTRNYLSPRKRSTNGNYATRDAAAASQAIVPRGRINSIPSTSTRRSRQIVRTGPALLPLDKKPSFAKVDGLLPIWPIDKDGNERCWRFVSPKMQKLIDARRVRLGKYNAAS